jgi:hypothetical protein
VAANLFAVHITAQHHGQPLQGPGRCNRRAAAASTPVKQGRYTSRAHNRILQPRLPAKPQQKSPSVNSNCSTPRQLAMYSKVLKGKHNKLALHRQLPVY